MTSTMTRVIDFREMRPEPMMKWSNGKQKSLTPKQLRARARRAKRNGKDFTPEMQLLYKPVEQWDIEELAKGRPKNAAGDFRGRPPTWVSREVYETAMDRFRLVIREKVQGEAAGALDIVHFILHNEETDEKGKPMVPASVKLDAAKWLTEHIIGKPTQKIESDISVKLQGVLAQCMVPAEMVGLPDRILPPVTAVITSAPETGDVWDAEELDDDS